MPPDSALVISMPRQVLHQEVAVRLRQRIVEGEIAPGAKLNERELSESLEVSRTPLREAIKMLAAEGLVELLPNRGAVAASLSAQDVADTFEVIAGLEGQSGELAAMRITDAELDEIRALHFEMLAAFTRRDLSNYYRLNARIHECINGAARNPVLTRTYRNVNARLQALRFRSNFDERKWASRRAGARADGRTSGRARCPGSARAAGPASGTQARRGARTDAAWRAQPGAEGPRMIEALAKRLRQETRAEVMVDAAARGRYATDASIYQIMPVAVCVPTCPEDVAIAIAIASDAKVPVLSRGGGTSQCGQTTGAALVIDHSKHLRRILAVDADTMTAEVEPGLVLDHLNAALKPKGLWYPVDVSTSAQATLGGMAGNNSCGSRSIAYGNMVHNVAGIDAWLADGTLASFGPVDTLGARERGIADFVRGLADRHRAQIETHWPKVLRRVGGYNLDIFHPQSERPYTGDGSVNLAHLLVGSEGTLAITERLRLKLSPLPRAKVLGVVNFASFHKAMDSAQHIVTLGPSAVELVDRTMIELARANPAFRTVIEAALIGAPDAILLVEFSGDDSAALRRQLKALVELMGDLGLPGSVVEMPDEAPQKALWEVRKAGLNIMMSLKGDGKPVSFIEDCAVPLIHLAEYTDALTEVFARHGTRGTWYAHASVGTLHVRPILDMRRSGPQAAPRRCAPSPRKRANSCAASRAPTAASMATGCAAGSGSSGSSARR